MVLIVHIFSLILPSIHYANATYINLDGISGDFVINNDANLTSSVSVTLDMDIAWAMDMRFGDTPTARDAAAWQTYSTTDSFTLTGSGWIKTVYAAFRSASWDIVTVSDEIILSSVATLPFSGGLTLWLDASDAGTISDTGWNISAWNDKSWNGYNALQTNGWNQPTLITNEIDFNGSSDYLYLENLNYTNANPLDGLLVCSVFRTPNTAWGLADNWAFLDFDRSEWFNFYNRWDGIGFSYDAGWIQDMLVTGMWVNDNSLHVSCASYDNTLTNDTIITVDGVVELSENREANGSQIWVWQATRFGFVWDGSEANSENGTRNNVYYDGGMSEILYFDSAVSDTNRQDIECYLGAKWWVDVAGCSGIWNDPIATIEYSPEITTSSNVVATLINESEDITITNNGWSNEFIFTSNGSFTFSFEDSSGNTGSTTAIVDWIDPTGPALTHTGWVNEAPNITSHGGTGSVSLNIGSGATDITTISAIDTIYNIVWEYGSTTLSGNSWTPISSNQMCNQVTTVSHRWNVAGEIQRAPRVRNKSGTGFEVKVDNYLSNIGALSTQIDYITMTAGSYDFWDGLLVEAGTQNTAVVACNANNAPTPTGVTFSSSFNNAPAVMHTIASENDTNWVVSGVNGNTGNRWSEPTTAGMWVVLQRSFNSCTHGAEDLDYIAFEPGHYTLIDWSILDAAVSTDSIAAVTTTWNPINFTSAFESAPATVLVSQLWEDGWNGWYAQIHTGGWVTTNQVFTTIDEDGPWADRWHTNEVASSVAFDNTTGQFWETNTLTYSITGWADSSEFTINPTTGKLDFVSWNSPDAPDDANTDGIYEVEVSACDSHCNSLCDTQTILANVGDSIDPTISSTNFASGSLLPGWIHTIEITYEDNESGIDSSSATFTLHKWDGIWAFGPDISVTNISSSTIWWSGSTYTTSGLSFWKYQYRFEISDNFGNSSTQNIDFYIDEPEFIISTPEIDIWVLDMITNNFSPTAQITVRTVGANFNVFMNSDTDLVYSPETLQSFDGTTGFGYQLTPFSGSITAIWVNESIASQWASINTNWDKNEFIFDIQLGGIVDIEQAAGEYMWNMDFSINLTY